MNMYKKITLSALVISAQFWSAQQTSQEKLNPVVQNIVNEANNNSQLENLAFELLDVIGPRLVGSPAMKQANDWAVEKYKSWGIDAQNQQFGEWASRKEELHR